LKAVADKEKPGEVYDLYHKNKFRWKQSIIVDDAKVIDHKDLDPDVERTPTKGGSAAQENDDDSIDIFVYHLTLTDLTLLDSRVQVPEILISASHSREVQDNSAMALHNLLANHEFEAREKMTFHLCTYIPGLRKPLKKPATQVFFAGF
jgi:hypothetical protein